jgi:hypothetical protein
MAKKCDEILEEMVFYFSSQKESRKKYLKIPRDVNVSTQDRTEDLQRVRPT